MQTIEMNPPEPDRRAREHALEVNLTKRVIKGLFKTFLQGETLVPWGQAFRAAYGAQLEIFSILLTEELTYRSFEAKTTQTALSLNRFSEKFDLFLKGVPKETASTPSEEVRELVVQLDTVIKGALDVAKQATVRVEKVNRFLGEKRTFNQFDLVLGHGTNWVARNDLCYSTKDFVDRINKLIHYRNRWATVVNKPLLRSDFRAEKMLTECEGAFY